MAIVWGNWMTVEYNLLREQIKALDERIDIVERNQNVSKANFWLILSLILAQVVNKLFL